MCIRDRFNDLPAHFSGADLTAMQTQYIGMFQAGWFVESMWSLSLIHIWTAIEDTVLQIAKKVQISTAELVTCVEQGIHPQNTDVYKRQRKIWKRYYQ